MDGLSATASSPTDAVEAAPTGGRKGEEPDVDVTERGKGLGKDGTRRDAGDQQTGTKRTTSVSYQPAQGLVIDVRCYQVRCAAGWRCREAEMSPTLLHDGAVSLKSLPPGGVAGTLAPAATIA